MSPAHRPCRQRDGPVSPAEGGPPVAGTDLAGRVVATTTLLALQLAIVAFDGGPVWVRVFFGLLPPLTIGLGITSWWAVLRHRLPPAPPGP